MSLSSMQSRVRSLRRRLIVPFVEMQVSQLADEFADDWQTAKAEEQPPPKSISFLEKVIKAGFWYLGCSNSLSYIDRCNRLKQEPNPVEIFQRAFPKPLKL